MECKICKSDNVEIIYNKIIRNGGLGRYTSHPVPMYQCKACGVIWHDRMVEDVNEYYESPKYRDSMNEGSDIEVFYQNHDRETFDKLQYTGTEIFRDKVVTDIGCGGGAFLDVLRGVAAKIIAIEPSELFRDVLIKKGFFTYSYAQDALQDWGSKVDVVTSFDVIEHVDNPMNFICDSYDLLQNNGTAIIGTPTDAPIMRSLLGECYEKEVLFSVQHLWILSGKSLCRMAKEAGFRKTEIRYYQRYGIGNLLGWCLEKKPRKNIEIPFISKEMDAAWKGACSGHEVADYVVLYATK